MNIRYTHTEYYNTHRTTKFQLFIFSLCVCVRWQVKFIIKQNEFHTKEHKYCILVWKVRIASGENFIFQCWEKRKYMNREHWNSTVLFTAFFFIFILIFLFLFFCLCIKRVLAHVQSEEIFYRYCYRIFCSNLVREFGWFFSLLLWWWCCASKRIFFNCIPFFCTQTYTDTAFHRNCSIRKAHLKAKN